MYHPVCSYENDNHYKENKIRKQKSVKMPLLGKPVFNWEVPVSGTGVD